ncbi:MAG: metallophosphoesterase [bacterium]|nr:metallophosphoesterase [Candidatus Sumerlaeota bacterium]
MLNYASDIDDLIVRVGEPHMRQRLELQVEHASEIFGTGMVLFHIENVEWLMAAIYYVLRATFLYGAGYRNFLDLRVRRNTIELDGLPEAFRGFRILHLSDLHADLDPALTDALIERLKGLDYDVCVLTGDYRASTSGSYDKTVDAMERLSAHIKSPKYAILGNHDFIEMAPPLERAGYRFLLNETVKIERGGEAIHLSGVDDPHFYMTENLHKACEGVPSNSITILLSHSPEIFRKAAAMGYDLMLCGHTHGGQFCLPGGVPVITNGRCPRFMVRGNWKHRQMKGYTSPGTGSCGVPARFFCPPEVALHELVPCKSIK